MIMFAAATGLRPSELFALEHGDVDRGAGVVQIRRAYANGRVKHTKTRLSRRAVPLQAVAVEALDQLRPREGSPLLFPNARGGHLVFRNFNRRHWKPVQKKVGIEPPRDLYELRHTYATFALRAVFALSRFMGTNIAMIDLDYGHLAIDSYQHAVSTPRRSRARTGRGRWVDTDANDRKAARRHGFPAAREAFAVGGGRSVDVGARSRDNQRCHKGLISSNFSKPSDGLEPSTPSLPSRRGTRRRSPRVRPRRRLTAIRHMAVRSCDPESEGRSLSSAPEAICAATRTCTRTLQCRGCRAPCTSMGP